MGFFMDFMGVQPGENGDFFGIYPLVMTNSLRTGSHGPVSSMIYDDLHDLPIKSCDYP